MTEMTLMQAITTGAGKGGGRGRGKGDVHLQSQHSSPAWNCPLKWSTELTPVPLNWEHWLGPGSWV